MVGTRYLSLYFAEADQNLRALDTHVLALEGAAEPESLHAAFRAAHNLKGMSATVGFQEVAARAHALEDRLDGLRAAEYLGPDAVDELLESVDALRAAVDDARTAEPAVELTDEDVAAALPATMVPGPDEVPADCRLVARVVFRADTPLASVRATLAVRRAEELVTVLDHAPPLDESFRGELVLFLGPVSDPAALEEALYGVGDVEAVVVESVDADIYRTEEEVVGPDAAYVRAERRHVDALADGVAELAARYRRLVKLWRDGDADQIGPALDAMGRLLAGLRVDAMGVRLVPVAEVFDRFPRLVRDAARSVGREVEFQLEGRSIEMDRAILNEVAEPVLHLLRNAVDHGIEPTDERLAAGKPERGQIVLRAQRKRAGVVIEVHDDGRGVPVETIRDKARAAGLEADEGDWSVEELLGVLSRPGFSAADRVSEISGRGVGLDVAVERIRLLGGAVEMDTEPGRGTTFRLHLPVSLAATEAVWIRLGPEEYAVPLTHVVEAVEVGGGVKRTGKTLTVDGVSYAAVELATVLSAPDGDARAALLVDVGGRRAALMVDALLGREEVVVKQFDAPRDAHPMLSGVTLRGDGRPALVLDPAAVV